MLAWVDNDFALWIQSNTLPACRCRDLTKKQLVVICEELDISPMAVRISPSLEAMISDFQLFYDFHPDEIEAMDSDLIEFYWEWARIPRKEICRAIYDYFCSRNIITHNCAVDQLIVRQAGRLPSFSTPITPVEKPLYSPLHRQRYRSLRLPRTTL